MERDPILRLNVSDGRELEVTRKNASLFRFFGELSLYDHVFVVTDEANNVGTFIFSTNANFEDIADYMMMNDYPAHLNLPAVADCDRLAFDNMVSNEVAHDLDGGVPEDWT